MATPIPQKVLVTGQANSSIRTFFTKLAGLQTKHSFSLCLALDLFSNIDNDSIELAELLAGKIEVPVQVYVAVGDGILPKKVLDKMARGEEVCRNVTVLNKAGVLSLASGLRIATFGGGYDSALFESSVGDELASLASPSFSQADVNSYISLLTPPPSKSSLPSPPIPSPDILITHSIPASISLLSANPLISTTPLSPATDEIARLSKAKYHFIGGAGVFWEREPFSWGNEMGGGSCRAISLGELGNKAKERWFYAFSITPRAPAVPIPANATTSPFNVRPAASSSGGPRGMKRAAGTMDAGVNEFGIPNFIFGGQGNNNQDRKKGRNNGAAGGPPPDHYTCNICDQKGHWIQECPEKATRDAERIDNRPSIIKPIQPDECWFCLSNPKLTKHLIASIGSEIYVTLPKGQIPPTGTDLSNSVSPVPGGGHVLIIPIAHYSTLLSIPSEAASPILSEIDQYKNALKECYAEYGAKMVSFEVGRLSGKKGGHAHIQICPVPDSLAAETESIFRSEGTKLGIEFEEDSEAATVQAAISGDYFRVGLPDGKTLVHIMKPKTSFNLQFGRATMALLMGIPERADWKACGQDTAEEKRDCTKFKAAFKKYDPSE